jgi:hypothetical protein
MNEDLFNQALKNLVAKTRANFSNADLKSSALVKALSPSNNTPPATSDSISRSSTAEDLLIKYQLPVEEENLNISNAFLKKDYYPTKEQIESVKEILKNNPNKLEVSQVIEKSVNLAIQGVDINDKEVQDTIVDNTNEESIRKSFDKIKSEVIKDKTIPPQIRVDISNEIDRIQKEINQASRESNPKISNASDNSIVDKIKNSVRQSDDKRLQKIVEIATDGLEIINNIVEDGIENQIQKDTFLQDTDLIHEEIGRLKTSLSEDRKGLLTSIENTSVELTDIKESLQKIIQVFESSSNSDPQGADAAFQTKVPAFLKLLTASDDILAKFGEYISAFPQSQKANNEKESPVNQELLLSNKQISSESDRANIISRKVSVDTNYFPNTKIANLINSLEQTIEKVEPSNSEGSKTTGFIQEDFADALLSSAKEKSASTNLSGSNSGNTGAIKLLNQVVEIADSLKNNLQAIKQVISQTAENPETISLETIIKSVQDNSAEFFEKFGALNLEASDFPELEKIKNNFSSGNSKDNLIAKNTNGNSVITGGSSKIISLEQLKVEIENIEREHFKASETIQSLKKFHEAIGKSESKLAVHQLLESPVIKTESIHAFEININPLLENKPTQVEIQQFRKTENSKISNSYSINIEVDLSQTGEVNARLFSSDNVKQIFLNFEDPDFKKIATEKQDELQTQLKEIPFISQIFFSVIPSLSKVSTKSEGNNSVNSNKLDFRA